MSEDARMSTPFKVQRKDTPVMFMQAKEDSAAAIQQAWADFERVVGLKGRRFFGTFDKETGEYRVCSEIRVGDDPKGQGFGVTTIPGGTYLCSRLQGEPPAVYARIRPTFEELVKLGSVDSSPPSIEFY